MQREKRIREMEDLRVMVAEAVRQADEALTHMTETREALRCLSNYYKSPLWRQDFEADEAGLLPPDLPPGVLSEDAVWNLLEEYDDVMRRMEDFITWEKKD